VVVFAYLGAYSLGEVRRVDPNAMVINVTGQQFSWTFEYPEYGFVTTELYLPVDRQVVLKMESARCHPFVLGARVPRQAGCCAGPHDRVPHHADRWRAAIQGPLRGVVRHLARLHGSRRSWWSNSAAYDAWVTEQVKIAEESKTP
jgi:hypothetical protein